MKVRFCGATTGVTGSCHLIMTENHNVLLDCGQFQGGKTQEKLNYEPFPFDPSSIQDLVLSHAHIDHCGRIPLLVKRGFTGRIYCSKATADLLPIMLRDSGYIHEKEAEWATKKAERKGLPPVEPLYTLADVEASLKYITPVIYGQYIDINEDMRVCFNDAGHILGSACVELWVTEGDSKTKIVFSGDIGVNGRPILNDPSVFQGADYVIMETTYGNRLHPENKESVQSLIDVIRRTHKRGGTVVIPSFAVGRTQELIYELNMLFDHRPELFEELKDVKVYIDSPMANAATEVFKANTASFDDEFKEFMLKGDHPLEFKNLFFTQNTQDSQALNNDKQPKVIISASGMCDAGRIRHHLKHNIWNPKSSIVFVGYQAEGTLGRKIVEGAKSVNLFGEEIMVQAEIVNLEGFSGHADRDGLLNWLSAFKTNPTVFLVHGEEEAKHSFVEYVQEKLGITPIPVDENCEFELEPGVLAANRDNNFQEIKTMQMPKMSEDDASYLRSTVNTDAMLDSKLSQEDIVALRNKISEIEESIGDILGSADQYAGSNLDSEKLIRVNNIIRQIEEDAFNLKSILLEEGENDFKASLEEDK